MNLENNKGNDQKRKEYTISITILQEDFEELIKRSSSLEKLGYKYTLERDKVIVSLQCNSKEDVEKLSNLLKDIIV